MASASAPAAALVSVIVKNPSALKPNAVIGAGSVALAIDASGSTQVRVILDEINLGVDLGILKKPEDRHCKRVSTTRDQPCIFWSGSSELVTPKSCAPMPFGGTRPSAIFEQKGPNDLVQSRAVFVLATDGQIDTPEVMRLNVLGANLMSSRSLNVGVLFGFTQRMTPANVNISVSFVSNDRAGGGGRCLDAQVLAPLFPHNHVIFAFKDNAYYVLAHKSFDLKNLRPVTIDAATQWTDLQCFATLSEFLYNAPLSAPHGREYSPNEMQVYEDEKEYRVVALKNLDNVSIQHIPEMKTWDWQMIAQESKLNSTCLSAFRNALVKLDHQLADLSTVRVEPDLQINAMAKKLMSRDVEGDARDKILAAYRKRLQMHDVKNAEAMDAEKAQRRADRAFVQEMLRMFAAVEQSGWDMASFSNMVANRAIRAGVVDTSALNDQLQHILTLPGLEFCTIECDICSEDRPAAILMIPGEDNKDEFYLSDFAIDCPLACGYEAARKIANIVLCTRCAKFFQDRGQDMFGRTLLGVWPVITGPQDQPQSHALSEYYGTLLKRVFLAGRNLGHAPQLMFAAIHNLAFQPWGVAEGSQWPKIRTALVAYMAKFLAVRRNLTSPTDPIVSLRTALVHVLDPASTEPVTTFNSKPLAMQYLMINVARELGLVPEPHLLLRERAAVACAIVKILRANHRMLPEIHKAVTTKCFAVHHFGVPVRGTFAPFPFDESLNSVVPTLVSVTTVMRANKSTLDAATWTELWLRLIGSSSGDKIQSVYHSLTFERVLQTLSLEVPYLRDVFNCQPTVSPEPSVGHQLFSNFHSVPHDHNKVPPFVLNLGIYSCPDPLECGSCGQPFIAEKTARQFSRESSRIIELVRENRANHFRHVFGSVHPDSGSAHCTLHATVAKVVTGNESCETKELVERVFEELNRSAPNKGDVFRPDLLMKAEALIVQFKALRASTPDQSAAADDTTRTLRHKVMCSLIFRKWI